MQKYRPATLLAACLSWVVPALAAERPEEVTLLVAPFAQVAPPGTALPDAARLLADRLGTRGLGRVVAPGELGLEALAEPTDAQVKAWAEAAKVDLVVVGRTTQIGKRVSLDVRLRSGANGSVLSTLVAEAPQPEDLGRAVDRLAAQIVDGALAAPSPVAAGPPGAGAAKDAKEDGGFLGFGSSDNSKEPISIQSDELEAIEEGETRRFVFKRNVRVKQGPMTITAREMEAFYPPGSSRPDKLTAVGNVILVQNDKRARCDRATFFRSEQRVVCTGNLAELSQQADRVRGKEIEFFLETERLIVRGGADVFLESTDQKGGGGTDGGGDGG